MVRFTGAFNGGNAVLFFIFKQLVSLSVDVDWVGDDRGSIQRGLKVKRVL